MLYQQFFTTIHDSLDLPYRHINRFRKPFVSQTVKQAELQDTPVSLGKHPLVNQHFPLGTALAEIFCFHRLPLFNFAKPVASWAFLVLSGLACFAYSCFYGSFNVNSLRHNQHLLRRLYLRRYRPAPHLSLLSAQPVSNWLSYASQHKLVVTSNDMRIITTTHNRLKLRSERVISASYTI